MRAHARRFWIVMIFAGWSVDFLFWKQSAGINFALFISLCLTAGIALLCDAGIRPARNSLLLIPLIGFFATMTFVRLEPMTLFLSAIATLGLMATLAVTYVGGNWLHYSLVDYVIRLAKLYASMFIRGIAFIQETRSRRKTVQDGQEAAGFRHSMWPIVRGALIAAPIVAIFTALLASADLVFAQRLGDITEIFRTDRIPEYMFRGTYIFCLAYIFAGVVLHAAAHSRDGDREWEFKPLLGFTETAVILGSVVVLFTSFVVIQFQYFFGGEKNIDVAGYSYADYARRGFGELVAVAVCSLLLLLTLSALSRRADGRERRAFTGLGVAVVGLVLVILVSAFQRILLYESAYGFSRLRTYTHVFLIWLGLLLVAVIILEILQRQRAFALAAVLTSLGFAASLALMNVDGFIVHQNVQRFLDGKELDTGYLESLSEDAVPAIADELHLAPVPSSLHDDLGRTLVFYSKGQAFTDERSWRSFHLAHDRAAAALDDVADEIAGFRDSGGGESGNPAANPAGNQSRQ
ncbi:MAG: DUF4153 domain-containing protein [Thermoleophilia bacterium]